MICYSNISLELGGRTLLRDVSLQVAKGEKVCLAGPSGCGKTSLLLLLLGRGRPTAGSVSLDGTPISAATLAAVRRRTAYIAQEHVLGDDRVRHALLLAFEYVANQADAPSEGEIKNVLARVRLPVDILDQPVAKLSGGEKQRVAIARALLLRRDIFLADEVTSSLDPESQAAVMDLLFADGITLLSVSHDPQWLAACDRVEIIDPDTLSLGPGAAARQRGRA